MKQNLCRYCALSTKTRYAHKPSHDNECVDCENLKKHVAYLGEHRKFVEGEPITDLTELLQQEWVIWHHQTKHIEVFKSMQLRGVLWLLEIGAFRKAVRKESEEKQYENY